MEYLNFAPNMVLILTEYLFFIIGQKIILTNGIIKKTNKTPKSAIDLAKKYKTDYEWRHRNEQLQRLQKESPAKS